MKKIVLTFIFISLLSFFAASQSSKISVNKGDLFSYINTQKTHWNLQKPSFKEIFFESFEDNFPPDGWMVFSYGNSTREWVATDRMVRSGSNSAHVHYSSAGQTMDEWLIMPALDLSQSPGATLIFYEDQQYWSNYGDHHYINISTTSQTDKSSFQTLLDMTPSNHTINGFEGAPVEIDLSSYLGQDTVYIAFRYTGSNADNWYIDDVGVYEPDEHDIKAVDLRLNNHYEPGTNIQPTATVKNVGLNTESFSVNFGYFDWDGTMKIIDAKTVENLEAGTSQSVSFENYTFDADIQYTFFAQADLAGDLDTRNDFVTKDVNTFTKLKMNVLIEKGTGTWCGFCPGSALAIDRLYHNYSDDLAILEYHNGDDYSNDMSRHRLSFYRIPGYPTAIFNGIDMRVGGSSASGDWMSIYSDYEFKFAFNQAGKTCFSLDLQVTDNGSGHLTAMSSTTYEAVSLLKSHRLFFALNESHIAESWLGLDSLQFVARAMFPDHNGTALYDGAAIPTVGMVVSDTVDVIIPEGVVQQNCQVVAFIQNMDSKEVMAATKVDLTLPVTVQKSKNLLQPNEFVLQQNYPNPFNPATWIEFQLPELGEVTIQIYNIQGQRIRDLVSDDFEAGFHKVHWNGKNNSGQDVASGIYYVKANNQKTIQTIKLLKLK